MTFLDFLISQFKYLVFLRPKSSNSKREDFTYNNLNLKYKKNNVRVGIFIKNIYIFGLPGDYLATSHATPET